jgi:gliding motility-associated lipoprotein GldH
MPKRILGFFAVMMMMFIGCRKESFFTDSHQMPGFWHKDSVVDFRFNVQDTLSAYNCFINIRNTEDYKYNNLFIITTMQFPYGKVVVDTLEYKMAFKNGELMGEGFGSLKYNKLWYKEAVQFSEPGEYQIQIRQAMRKAGQTEPLIKLEGIEEVGFSYEPLMKEKS